MRLLRFAPVVAILLVGCIEPLKPSRERTGFISATTVALGAGPSYGLTFVGAFYRWDDLELQFQALESCAGFFYSPTPPPLATFPTLDAGARLITQVSGRQDTLFKSTELAIETYHLTSVNSVPHTPGDTLTLTIPGTVTGFPPQTVRVRTSEPFVLGPVNPSAPGDPITLTWTPAPAPGSTMLVSLRYNSVGTTDVPDTELRCAFADDGSGTVIPSFAGAWSAAAAASRSVIAQRVRYTRVEMDALTKVILLSFFDWPTPTGTP